LRLTDGHLRHSASDLNTLFACEHATGLDLRRGRGEITLDKAPRPDADLVVERAMRSPSGRPQAFALAANARSRRTSKHGSSPSGARA